MSADSFTATRPQTSPAGTQALAAEHGLSAEEWQTICRRLGRVPNLTELGLFGAMWSEHCSYKSSRVWLRRLPVQGPQVIQGPGENAGVVDIGAGLALVFKMESHNHPSFIEPYQGAATGVGGILRDVFTMGARPFASLNALRFGDPAHPRTRHLVAGVVGGIGGYGNCVGVATVGGETNFHPAYNGNILVNAMTVGVVRADAIAYARGARVGDPVLYVGAKTGRDGIKGAVMASAGFGTAVGDQRPTVQVGDPFKEKLLLEACLELIAAGAVIAIQDMGAAGLTSSSIEIAAKSGVGIRLTLDDVPQREPGMTPYEIMLSESQERMLVVLEPGREAEAQAIFETWELDATVIGEVVAGDRITLHHKGATEADLPIAPLADEAPRYERPFDVTPAPAPLAPGLGQLQRGQWVAALKTLVGCPDLASRRWIWEQYDSLVGGDTVLGPGGGDAAVVRVPGGDGRMAALTSDCTPRYVLAEPHAGGMQAVAEAWRNLTAVGAVPLALTDNLNFGDVKQPPVMGQLVGAIEGMAEACHALAFPVVSGNVSLYNATDGRSIPPTPVIGGVGLVPAGVRPTGVALTAPGRALVLLGWSAAEGRGHLGQSLYLREVLGREEGPPPPVDLRAEKATGDLVRALIHAGLASAVHDVSDGGLLVALAEMTMASGLGATLTLPSLDGGLLFGEDQGRYVVETADAARLLARAEAAGVPARLLGHTGGTELVLVDERRAGPREAVEVAELRRIHQAWFPAFMAG